MSESIHQAADDQPARHYINNGSTIASWLFTVDHKRIALMYLASLLVFFLLGGAAAAFVRLDLMTPGGRSAAVRDLQQALHHARHCDDLLFPGPLHSLPSWATSWCPS
jgi:hypothetical protein